MEENIKIDPESNTDEVNVDETVETRHNRSPLLLQRARGMLGRASEQI